MFVIIVLDNLFSVKTFYLAVGDDFDMDKKFCGNLKNARKESGLTQKQVAISLGVVESCYANWEQVRTEPNIDMLRKICAIFDISIDEMING